MLNKAFWSPMINPPLIRIPKKSCRVCGRHWDLLKIYAKKKGAVISYLNAASSTGGKYSRAILTATKDDPKSKLINKNWPRWRY